MPVVAVVFLLLQHFYLRTSRQMRMLDIEYKAPLHTKFIETLNGLVTIRAFGWVHESQRQLWQTLDDSQRPRHLLFCLQRWFTFTIDTTIAFIAILLISLTTTLRQQIGPGYIGLALSNVLVFSVTMKSALSSWVTLEISIGAVARIKQFVSNAPLRQESQRVEGPWPKRGQIEFQSFSASYG